MIKYSLFEKILEKVEIVFNKKIKEDKFKDVNSLFNTTLEINILGQKVERSYEDRSVYFNLKFINDKDLDGNLKKEKDIKEFTTWINGEKAIELGQMLISHGLYALESNMINHQKIHHYSQLEKFLSEDRIEKIILKKLNENPNDYDGAYIFNVKPIWKVGKEPKYQEDFEFEDVIYLSPFEDEFKKQMKSFGGIKNVEFVNYDREKEIKKFNVLLKKQK